MRRLQFGSGIEIVAGEGGENELGGVKQVVEEAGGREQKFEWGRGICPAKLKTECNALGIGLILKCCMGSVVRMCWVELNIYLKWWEAGARN
jgi:hypothetical protein